jgi:hypothetical protein
VHGTVLHDANATADAGAHSEPDSEADSTADHCAHTRADAVADRNTAHATAFAHVVTDADTDADSGVDTQRASWSGCGRTRRRGGDDRFVRVDLASLLELIARKQRQSHLLTACYSCIQ